MVATTLAVRTSLRFTGSATGWGLPGASSVMVTVAVRPPVAAGVNVTVKAQLADAATGPPAGGHGATPEPATAKAPGLDRERVGWGKSVDLGGRRIILKKMREGS